MEVDPEQKADDFFYEQQEEPIYQEQESGGTFMDWLKSLPSTVLLAIFVAFILGVIFSKSLSTVIVKI